MGTAIETVESMIERKPAASYRREQERLALWRHKLAMMGFFTVAGGATGTAVATGDIITAAKMNLKQETGADLAALSVLDQSGAGSFSLGFVASETLTADRNLTVIVNNAARTIDLSGNITLAGALTTDAAVTVSGAFALTLTVSNTTNATIPAGTVTLMDLSTAQTVTGAKRFADDAILVENPAATFYYTLTGAAIAANRVLTLPLLAGNDTLVTADFAQTLTNKTLTAPDINGGTADSLTSLSVRSTGAAFDLTLGSTEVFTAGRTLTITVNDAARTIDLGGNLTLAAAFTTVNANAITLTTSGATALTLPTAGTLAILGANTFTGAQTFAGNVDTVLNITTSPILDIGADVFSTGTFIDIAYDTAETLTGALIGINVDLSTNVTISDQSVTGLDVTLPATFGAGTEFGIRVRGDGQTIIIGQDADVYLSLAKANSVDITVNGVSPVIGLGADVFSTGTFVAITFDTAEVATAALTGISVNLNTNLTPVGGSDVVLYTGQTPAFTNAAAATTNLIGYSLPTAGALVMNNAGGTLNFVGLNIQMPNITQTAGTMTAMGIQLVEGTTTSGTINAININGVVDTIINFSASPIIDIGADVFSTGTIMDFAFDTAEVATGALIGVSMNMNTNLTPLGGQDVTAYTCQTPAFTNAAAAATVLTGFRLPTAGALVNQNAGGSITWYGLDLQLPNVTQTAGAMVAYGIRIVEGTTTSGTAAGILLDGNVDTVLNLTASPIVDIGADVFSTGYFADIGFDTIETLTGQLTGIRIDWDTAVVTTGGAGTGNITAYWADLGQLAVAGTYNAVIYGIRLDLDFTVGGAETIYGASIVMPATYGGGTEVALRITGDGQTILIGNDADLYASFAKANSVDVNLQGVSPVVDIGADVLVAGYFISIDYDTAETTTGDLYILDVLRAANALTLGGDLYGVNLDFNTNVTAAADRDVFGYRVTTPALTSAGAVATTFRGVALPTAGALVMNNGGGSLTWYGADLQMPNITQTAGTMTATGIRITEGTTTSGTATGININVTRAIAFAKASDIILPADTAAVLDVNDGTTNILRLNTQVTTDNVVMATLTSAPVTIASAAGTTYRVMSIPAFTVTLTGGTGVTAMNGLGLFLGSPTITSGAATTITTASTLYLGAPSAAGGGPAAITNNYIINTSAAGCFLTAAGVWTDASSLETKRDIGPVDFARIPGLLDTVELVSFRKRDASDGGYERFGVIAEDAPDFLASADHRGIAAVYMAGFTLAAVKWLESENRQLKARLAEVETKLSALGA